MKLTDSTPSTPETTQLVYHTAGKPKTPLASSAGNARDLICFSHLRWNFVYQRPQHLLSRAAQQYRVWFLEEPIWADQLYLNEQHQSDSLTVLVPHLPHGTTPDQAVVLQRQLLDEFIQQKRIVDFVAWYYTPMSLLFSDHLQPQLTVYDCMDELSAFWGAPPHLLEQERKLLDRADMVFTGGYSLYEAKQKRHRQVFAFPSSIDFAHFSAARRPQPDPADQRALANPRIGFSGVIDERFDYQLLTELAQRRPDWQFVLIGPTVKIDPALLPQRPNVHYLGMKNYKELPVYFANWDVAMLPFARNESTRFISPTKTPEYLAAGLPVVSTSIRDVVRTYGTSDFVQIADTAQAFEAAIDRALRGNHPEHWADIDTFLSENSWDHTWASMNRIMTTQLSMAIEQ
ncbi:glycosyltransferase family 1 protein [Spirosoma montaniterrae]|uniref:Glycosyl transferase n=1 Tax=Spirosoma montaniterrae TaxID=1178516 RepID=A0A1P9WY92_9BACT|nr:glycosyltransferase family 1 protein [Spirosoma montaniterrae]AQG80356.1 glycosyl transferase [Spirosoma montaniterrae]